MNTSSLVIQLRGVKVMLLRCSTSYSHKTGLETLIEQLLGRRRTHPSRPHCLGRNFHVSMFGGSISNVRLIHLGDRLLSFSFTSCTSVCIIVYKHKEEKTFCICILYLKNNSKTCVYNKIQRLSDIMW